MLGIGANHLVVHFIDYPVYDLAGLKVLHRQALALYDLNRTTPGGYYYPYFFALVFSIFSYLGYAGKILFYIIFCLSYIKILKFSVDNSLKLLGETNSKFRYLIYTITLLATTYAVNDGFMNANIGIFLMVLSIYAYELRDKNPLLAGALIASAMVFKIYPAFIFGFFIWNKNWRTVLYGCLFTIFLYAGVPILVNGYSEGIILLKNQYTVLDHFGSHWPLNSTVFQNLTATTMRLFPNIQTKQILLPSFLIIFIALLPSFLKNKKNIKISFQLKIFFLILALTPILTPVSWYNMALFYAPVIAYMTSLSIIKKDKLAVTLLSAYILLFCLTTPGILGNRINDMLEYYAVPFIGVSLMLLAYLVRLRRYDDCGSL